MSDRIRESWVSFARQVIPRDAPAIQRQEMMKAFYAGAAAVMEVAFEIGGDDVSMDQGEAILESLQAELDRYVIALREGRG